MDGIVCFAIEMSSATQNWLSMSVIGFQKTKFGWRVGGWGELYPVLFWIFLNFAKPLNTSMVDIFILDQCFIIMFYTLFVAL